jgi:hypothetical protein
MPQSSFDITAVWDALTPEQQRRFGLGGLLHAYAVNAPYFAPVDERFQNIALGAAETQAQNMLGQAVAALPLFKSPLARPDLTVFGVAQCRECGCTDDHACPEGCHWVKPDLCSNCIPQAAE